MLAEVLLVLPIHLTFFGVFWKFSLIIKMVEQLDRFLEVVDTPQEATENSRKRDFLQGLVESGEGSKISDKTPWTRERLEKASVKVMGKTYTFEDLQKLI